jgi:hypothetical protein
MAQPVRAPIAFTNLASSDERRSNHARLRRTHVTSDDRYRSSGGKAILHEYRVNSSDTLSDDSCDDDPEEDLVYFGCLSPQMVIAIFFITVSLAIWGVAIYFGMVRGELSMRELFSFEAWAVRCTCTLCKRALQGG